jgi:putative transposase
MGRLSFKKGTVVRHNNQEWEIVNILDLDKVLLKSRQTGDIKTVLPTELEEISDESSKKTKKDAFLEGIRPELWDKAKERFEIIKPLIKASRTKKEVEERAKEFGLNYVTLYRWIKNYESTGKLSSLVPNLDARGGKGKSRLNSVVDQIITESIEELYLTLQKTSINRVYAEIKKRCENAGFNPPHINTVRRRIKEISTERFMKKRMSRSKAESIYGLQGDIFEARCPLDIVQIDHTPLDIILVDEVLREPVGRPYITVAIDIYSRMIFGFYLSFDPPSFFTVGQALSMGIFPKEKFLKKLEIEGEWKIWGLPRTIHVDNAMEFRGSELRKFCEEYNIELSFRPVGKPRYGGHVERFIGTLNNELHSLPGTTFSRPDQKGDYKPDKKAVMTIGELEKWITGFIVNIYHKKVHSGIDMSPEEKYRIGIFGDEVNPGTGLPDIIQGSEAQKIKMALLPSEERTIQRFGVTIDGIKYFSDVLRKYVEPGRQKKKYLFKIDPRDISVIYFYDPEMKEYFSIPYRNLKFPPISVWELKQVKKYLTEKKNLSSYDEFDIFKAYEELKKLEQESIKKSKAARRNAARKKVHKEKMEMREESSSEAKPLYKAVKDRPEEEIKEAVENEIDDMMMFDDDLEGDDLEIVKYDEE